MTLESIQCHSMRFILNIPRGSSHTQMRKELNLLSIGERMKILKNKYLSTANENMLLNQMIEQYKLFRENEKEEKRTFLNSISC
jgi:hypothetical protein